MNQKNLLEVDWSKIPAPSDDGAAAHLVGITIPPIGLVATDDTSVTLSALAGRTVVDRRRDFAPVDFKQISLVHLTILHRSSLRGALATKQSSSCGCKCWMASLRSQ